MAQQVKHSVAAAPQKPRFTDTQIQEFKHAFELFDKVSNLICNFLL